MPRFVLLYHECPTGVPRPTHWDLMLEAEGVLRTWVVCEPPATWSQPLSAEEIQPHRVDYLDLEGPLTGGRGAVTRMDRGSLEPRELDETRVCVQVFGSMLRGVLTLTRTALDAPWWQLTFVAADD